MLTDSELRQAADRAIDRAVRRVFADDRRLDLRQRMRLLAVMRFELEKLRQNFEANGEGVVLFNVTAMYPAIGEGLPQLYVYGGRTRQEI